MKISDNKYVAVIYDLNVGEGEERELMEKATREVPLKFIYGTGMMIPAFEKELMGLEPGQKFNFSIAPALPLPAPMPLPAGKNFSSSTSSGGISARLRAAARAFVTRFSPSIFIPSMLRESPIISSYFGRIVNLSAAVFCQKSE